jgi:hypothetical protein
MKEFDPSVPAALHDRVKGAITAWTGDHAAEFRQAAVSCADGTIRWRNAVFDGWGHVLGG